MKTFHPLWWHSSGNPSCCLWFHTRSKDGVFLQSSGSTGRGFHCNCHLAPGGSHWGSLNCSPAHAVPVHPTHSHILFHPSNQSLGWHSVHIPLPKTHFEHPDYGWGVAKCCFCLGRGHTLYPSHDSIEKRHQQSYFSRRDNLPIKRPSLLKGSQFYTCFAFKTVHHKINVKTYLKNKIVSQMALTAKPETWVQTLECEKRTGNHNVLWPPHTHHSTCAYMHAWIDGWMDW